jgi:uncharacterized OB-fold protein
MSKVWWGNGGRLPSRSTSLKPRRGIFGLRDYRIFGYRCKNCGFVEFYAKE